MRAHQVSLYLTNIVFCSKLFADAEPLLSPPQLAIKEDLFWLQLVKMMIGLGAILGVTLMATWAFKRMVDKKGLSSSINQRIIILEKRSLTAKTQLYLLDVEGYRILASESAQGFQPLAHWNPKACANQTMEEDV